MYSLKEQHPEWYHATDYRWLEQETAHKTYPAAMGEIYARVNELDDIHRRDMASWADDDDYHRDDY